MAHSQTKTSDKPEQKDARSNQPSTSEAVHSVGKTQPGDLRVKNFRRANPNFAMRARHSAPDLTFGGQINLETFVATHVRFERRRSLGGELEQIEEENLEDLTKQDVKVIGGEKIQMPGVSLPPIFESQRYKLGKRDLSAAAVTQNIQGDRVRLHKAAN